MKAKKKGLKKKALERRIRRSVTAARLPLPKQTFALGDRYTLLDGELNAPTGFRFQVAAIMQRSVQVLEIQPAGGMRWLPRTLLEVAFNRQLLRPFKGERLCARCKPIASSMMWSRVGGLVLPALLKTWLCRECGWDVCGHLVGAGRTRDLCSDCRGKAAMARRTMPQGAPR